MPLGLGGHLKHQRRLPCPLLPAWGSWEEAPRIPLSPHTWLPPLCPLFPGSWNGPRGNRTLKELGEKGFYNCNAPVSTCSPLPFP